MSTQMRTKTTLHFARAKKIGQGKKTDKNQKSALRKIKLQCFQNNITYYINRIRYDKIEY